MTSYQLERKYKTSEARREYAKQYKRNNAEQCKIQRKKQYAKNPTYFRDKRNEYRKMAREIIQQQKEGKACVFCGIADPRVLDFHHLDHSTKSGSIGGAASAGWGIKRLLQEIAKCEIVCANCHRILHWNELKG